jgi:hypothetical protein
MDRKKRTVTLLILILLLGSQLFAATGLLKLNFDRTAYVGGVKVDRGSCLVTWKGKDSGAEVTFSQNGKLLVTVPAKFVELEGKSMYDSYVLEKDGSGNDAIRAIYLRGKKSILQFE